MLLFCHLFEQKQTILCFGLRFDYCQDVKQKKIDGQQQINE